MTKSYRIFNCYEIAINYFLSKPKSKNIPPNYLIKKSLMQLGHYFFTKTNKI